LGSTNRYRIQSLNSGRPFVVQFARSFKVSVLSGPSRVLVDSIVMMSANRHPMTDIEQHFADSPSGMVNVDRLPDHLILLIAQQAVAPDSRKEVASQLRVLPVLNCPFLTDLPERCSFHVSL
jgi:hypothetical protein